MVNLGVLEHLMRFVEIQNEHLDKEVFWLISNVLAGTQEHIQVSTRHSSVLVFSYRVFYTCWFLFIIVSWYTRVNTSNSYYCQTVCHDIFRMYVSIVVL